ncbi:tetraacyldisaccharide 4'-kinase [Croceitalea rosinachiae]|uniref:Tetraacyldisaccharide 4'-kinase n=1 Tax=Croceitalea rosinachiae TaxID=3075596 RepID=A0ABU3AE07_9FLAO|nr:tetraacyldisaccharide 4'-kinase [Croceitalea sp. F388]MDT0608424.1 tetraacyldisaccharide 4'-kinase [Croceitalea sp. F388]
MQLLRKLLFPISLLYGIVIYMRNYLYDSGFFKSQSFKTLTICVGNLSVGGTGKTPMIEYLINILQNDFKIAVLSRGYRRKSKGFQLADDQSTVEKLGDEPFQIYKKFDKIDLAVDSNRCNGILNLENSIKPDLILLDDAFQHRKVKPSFNILLTAYDNLFVKDVFLPTGTLRDAKNQAKRSNVIIVTKCPNSLPKDEQNKIIKQLNLEKTILFSSFEYAKVLRSKTEELSFEDLKIKQVSLVTGIANPKPLVKYLEFIGVVFKHFEFGDHHFFSKKEISKFKDNDYIITTEKDFMRLEGKVENLFYLEVRHRFLNGGDLFLKSELEKVIKLNPQS